MEKGVKSIHPLLKTIRGLETFPIKQSPGKSQVQTLFRNIEYCYNNIEKSFENEAQNSREITSWRKTKTFCRSSWTTTKLFRITTTSPVSHTQILVIWGHILPYGSHFGKVSWSEQTDFCVYSWKSCHVSHFFLIMVKLKKKY